MNRKTVVLLVILWLAWFTATPRAAAQADPEDAAVRQTVQYYFDGLKNRDIESLKKAFHPDARLYATGQKNELMEMTQAQWHERVKPSAENSATKWVVTGRIASLEITGSAASVKTIVDFPRVEYTDYLSLLKLNGEWKIVNKIYVAKRKAQ